MSASSTAPSSLAAFDSSIAVIGGGNMAQALIGGLLRRGLPLQRLTVAEPDAGKRAELAARFGIAGHADNAAAAQSAAIWVLAVKPQVLRAVCKELAPLALTQRPLLISIAAGIRTPQIAHWLGTALPLVRAMPNTPALLGAGASGLYADAAVDGAGRARAEAILGALGVGCWVEDEAQMDIVTALSGSGPAYFFLLTEALQRAAQAQGLPAASARLLATHTALGAGRMLVEDGADAATLRTRVTSPGGTTAAALQAYAAGGFEALVAQALAAASARGAELAAQAADAS